MNNDEDSQYLFLCRANGTESLAHLCPIFFSNFIDEINVNEDQERGINTVKYMYYDEVRY